MKKDQTEVKLLSLRGIGDTVASKLISYYGTEARAISNIAEGNIFSLIEAGLSEKIALKIVRSYQSSLSGQQYEETLQTQDINQIYGKIIKLIQNYSLTSYGKSKILVDIFPTQNKQKINQNRTIFQTALNLTDVNSSNIDLITKILSDFKPLEVLDDFEVKRRILLTTIPEVMKSLKNLKINNYIQIELIRSFEELKNYDTSEELLLLLTEHDFDESYYPSVLALPENVLENPWINILPEKIMNFFLYNLKTLKKAIELIKIVKISEPDQKLFPNIQDQTLSPNMRILENTLQKINTDGSLKVEISPELKRLKLILNSF